MYIVFDKTLGKTSCEIKTNNKQILEYLDNSDKI